MVNVLEKIVLDKKQEIAQRKMNLPLASFIDALTPSDRSFYDALAQPNAGFVLECKKASPSKGLIRENFDLDEIIQAYSPYAACISVLTDEKYFQGKFEYLEYIRSRMTQPVINKDFFVEPYQIYLARYHNADAVLLMLSVLDDTEYTALATLAEQYQLDVLTEVSNEQEVLRACALQAKIIGINNRDLRDLSTDLATTERLVPLIKHHATHQHVLISESGIYTHQDVRRLAPLVDGFLVGSSLMCEKDIELAAKQLVYGKVKICGTTSLTGAKLVKDSPASFAGLIFAEKSKRFVTLEQAKQITYAVPFYYVGVFVNAPIEQVVNYAQVLALSAVQLHGQENQTYIDSLRMKLPTHCQIWLAKGVTDVVPTLDEHDVDYFLLDCQVGEQSGGTGQAFSWQLLDEITDKSNIVLAGGITPNNVKQAANLQVAMLDLNSGVESAPGIKQQDKINQAFKQLREY
ncbi:bifunctional indole-3-glycerol-phosphate synthase TrpC/phosphoribosylanthranilate isomerase TrpF [Paraglaciecola sp. MB-3u-78]|uniref:bifunctional indole-3-glycerol-phosphate synthase TrpC/phosphoribosylanthranilate isomerase TrpF n=1 Tax=Paraglaciecola sp. MB-3u-78 TaxID=2058332 RepID=UPI000C34C210|nr:bifunctional indole-3-glycerol-phosphate synthase TrpC/phosphoribosylanthranilate isomerase TrpF [Paraglaciecola sp. MB-3u-78]PKG97133.1 bifunctional indole-3-glycerol-phosphate synthase TrpC/phosphoribosylanthranilate isomerase TrpF [Paraglaciecola sp. MB-3u-78]